MRPPKFSRSVDKALRHQYIRAKHSGEWVTALWTLGRAPGVAQQANQRGHALGVESVADDQGNDKMRRCFALDDKLLQEGRVAALEFEERVLERRYIVAQRVTYSLPVRSLCCWVQRPTPSPRNKGRLGI